MNLEKLEYKKNVSVAPKWLEEPLNSSLLLGRKGSVSCSASGYPQPQVHWMKKDGNCLSLVM